MDFKSPQIPAKPALNSVPAAPAIPVAAPTGPVSTTPPGATPQVRIIFYCKDCRKVVEGSKVGNKYIYKCPVCHSKNVAFGTEKAIKSYYHVAP